jgi:hypothetical protein
VLPVKRLRGAEVHGYAVLDHPILLQDAIEHVERTAAVDHVVFGDDLKPVNHRLLRQDVVVVWDAKSDADTIVGEGVKSIRRHGRSSLRKRGEGFRKSPEAFDTRDND